MARQLILLPPSEGKADGGKGAPWTPGSMADADLDGARSQVLEALRKAMKAREPARSRLLGVKGEALAAATAANLAATSAPTMPAIARYTGVLYDHLDAASLRGTALRRFNARVRILSGLWGAVAPRDPIPDYKLKMDAALPGLAKLSTWWRPHLSPVLDGLADGAVVWDLLPNAHAAAWRGDPDAPRARWSLRFTQEGPGGGRTTISHWNKALKGAVVRYLVTAEPAVPEDLAGFDHPDGYVLDLDASDLGDGSGVIELVRPAP